MPTAEPADGNRLPPGFRVGHWTDHEASTGCTAILCPPGSVSSCEVRGGGPGTRESDLLSPAGSQPGAQAILLTGGSAFGLRAAEGAMDFLAERGIGAPTPAAPVPLVSAAVVYDLALGDPLSRPDATAGYAACAAAAEIFDRGSVGVGAGCTVGKMLGPDGWTKGGVGYARLDGAGAAVAAVAAVNAFGEVIAEDGSVLAGPFRDGRYVRTVDLIREGHMPTRSRESTTLVCVMTDARLTKTEAWLVARAASAGLARAVDPCATAVDGDVVFCAAAGTAEADPFAISVLAAEATAASIRDAVRQAAAAPGAPSAADRRR